MKTDYQLDEIHKIQVIQKPDCVHVRFFEKMGDRWVCLGPDDIYASMADVRYEYGI